MIRIAYLQDLDRIKEITEACALHMESKGIFQWNTSYPSREAFEEDIEKKELYVYIERDNKDNEKEELLGCMVMSEEKDEVYANVYWPSMGLQSQPSTSAKLPSTSNQDKGVSEDNVQCFYIHRLAVDPSFQGSGIGQKLMNYAERYGREKGYISIRLDTFSLNERNQRFYTSLGYKKLDHNNNVFFPDQSEHPFYCFEKIL